MDNSGSPTLLRHREIPFKPKYHGLTEEGKQNGFGHECHKDGTKYDGDWKNGQYHGKGTYWDCDFTYKGHWEEGMKQGRGKLFHNNRLVYDGEWSKNRFHGHGTLYDGGFVYTGGWHEGLKHGKGCLKWDKKVVYKGTWDRGEFLPQRNVLGFDTIPSPPFCPLRGGPPSHERDNSRKVDESIPSATHLYSHTRRMGKEEEEIAPEGLPPSTSCTASWAMFVHTGNAEEAMADPAFLEHIAQATQDALELKECKVTVEEVKTSALNREDLYVTLQAVGATASLARVRVPMLKDTRVGWVKVLEVHPVMIDGEVRRVATAEGHASAQGLLEGGVLDPECEQNVWAEMVDGAAEELKNKES